MKIVVENNVLVNVEVDYDNDISVKEFTVPDGVTEIANEALGCLPSEVETLYIPKSVEKIDEGAFFSEVSTWEKLKKIVVEVGNKNYKSETGCLIDVKNSTVMLGTENAIIPDGTEKIGFEAFNFRKGLTEITIPESVKIIDFRAISFCPNLKKVTILGKDTNMDRLCFIWDTAIEEFNIPKESDYEFIDGALIKKRGNILLLVTDNGAIPSTVKCVEKSSIVRYAKDIEIPESVEEFGDMSIILLGGSKLKIKKDSTIHKYAIEKNIPYEEI